MVAQVIELGWERSWKWYWWCRIVELFQLFTIWIEVANGTHECGLMLPNCLACLLVEFHSWIKMRRPFLRILSLHYLMLVVLHRPLSPACPTQRSSQLHVSWYWFSSPTSKEVFTQSRGWCRWAWETCHKCSGMHTEHQPLSANGCVYVPDSQGRLACCQRHFPSVSHSQQPRLPCQWYRFRFGVPALCWVLFLGMQEQLVFDVRCQKGQENMHHKGNSQAWIDNWDSFWEAHWASNSSSEIPQSSIWSLADQPCSSTPRWSRHLIQFPRSIFISALIAVALWSINQICRCR